MCAHHFARRRPDFDGFTLIELLVVIVIIGVLVAGVTLAIGVVGRDRESEDQAQRLWAVMSQIKEESELQGRNIGVLVDRTGYEFVQFDSQKWTWTQIADDDLLTPRQLPEGLSLKLSLEGREVVLKPHSERVTSDKPKEESESDLDPKTSLDKLNTKRTLKDADMAPQIMLLASGDVNVFELSIVREGVDDSRWRIFSKPDNTIDVEPVGDSNVAP
jgi:general secretion pathway protein H